MTKTKIGVIGCGARGEAFINLTVNHFDDSCELIAICDKYQTQLDKAKEKYNINSSVKEYVGETAYKSMLQNETLDFVCIATPWEYHADMVIECMNNGIRSGCEVPIATTVE